MPVDEENLIFYLRMLKQQKFSEKNKAKALLIFEQLYDRCRGIIADLYEEDTLGKKKKIEKKENEPSTNQWNSKRKSPGGTF